MAEHLADRVVPVPELSLQNRTAGIHTRLAGPRLVYDRDEKKEDQSPPAGRGIVIAVLLSAPIWALAGVLIYYLAR